MTSLLLLSGCLFLAEPPPGADPSPECVDTGCPNGFGCDTFNDRCALTCDDVELFCQDGYRCELGTCIQTCEEGECPDNLACNSLETACLPSCNENDDCVTGYDCCTTQKRDNGRCDDVGACF